MQVTAETALPEITLDNFEETVAAFGAVMEVEGENHPLLQPSHEVFGWGTSLWDELYHDDSEPRKPRTTEESAVILRALHTLATEKTTSNHAAMASLMIGEAEPRFHRTSLPVPRPSLRPLQPEATHQTKLPQRRNRFAGQQLILRTFGEVQTARKSVKSFRAKPLPALDTAIETIDPFQPKPLTFDGRDARIIRRALKRASKRNKTIFDASAAHKLHSGR